MHFIHGLIAWLSGHCWGCRLGAKWQHRLAPGSANPAFVSPAFLWFAFVLTLTESSAIVLFSRAPSGVVTAAVALGCVAGGLVTGLAHGREPYSML
jgi:H+/Cl- antiporter ClcA